MARTTLSTFTFSPPPSRIESASARLIAKPDRLGADHDPTSLIGKQAESIELEGVIVNQAEYGLGSLSEEEQIQQLRAILDERVLVDFFDQTWGSATVLVEDLRIKREPGQTGYSYFITLKKE